MSFYGLLYPSCTPPPWLGVGCGHGVCSLFGRLGDGVWGVHRLLGEFGWPYGSYGQIPPSSAISSIPSSSKHESLSLHHFQALLHIICQTFNCKCTLKVVQRWLDRFCQILTTVTLQVLTLFIGTALDILHFCMSAKVFVSNSSASFICQVQP